MGDLLLQAAQKIEPAKRALWIWGELKKLRDKCVAPDGSELREPVVGPEEFIVSDEYLNAKGLIYPNVLSEVIELNNGKYVEAVLTGAIGAAKTTVALYTQAYQLYVLLCLPYIN